MAVRHTEHEFTLSFRQQETGALCAYLTLIVTQPGGARSVELSRHITGYSLERLIDDGEGQLRHAILEHLLYPTSPF
jgi:hypothetical protein